MRGRGFATDNTISFWMIVCRSPSQPWHYRSRTILQHSFHSHGYAHWSSLTCPQLKRFTAQGSQQESNPHPHTAKAKCATIKLGYHVWPTPYKSARKYHQLTFVSANAATYVAAAAAADDDAAGAGADPGPAVAAAVVADGGDVAAAGFIFKHEMFE
jgi:hypothetical protein